MNKKIQIGISTLAVIVLGLGMYYKISENELSAEHKPKLRIGTLRGFSTLDYVAAKQGYFEQEGLVVESSPYLTGKAGLDDLFSGKLDLVYAAEFVGVRYSFEHENLRVITQVSNAELVSIFAKEISDPKQLKGKKIGLIRKTGAEYLFGRHILLQGLTMQDVAIVDIPNDNVDTIVNLFNKGEIDAVVPIDPNTTVNLKKRMGSVINSWPIQNNWKVFPLVYTTKEFIDANPNLIERYLRSLKRAEEYAQSYPAETKEYLSEVTQYDPEVVGFIFSHHDYSLGLNQQLLVLMEDQAQWLIENKLTNHTEMPDFLRMLYLDGLKKVKPEAVRVIE